MDNNNKTILCGVLILVFLLGLYAGFLSSWFLRIDIANAPTQEQCKLLGERDMSWWALNDRVLIDSPGYEYHGLVGKLKVWRENAGLWNVWIHDKSGDIQCPNLKPSQIHNITRSE